MKIFLIFLSAFLYALGGGLLIFFLGYIIAISIVPNETPDGYVEMPIPQMVIGIIMGIIGFIVILIISYKKLKKKIN